MQDMKKSTVCLNLYEWIKVMDEIYIRTDMNNQIATGHMMRCLAIADALQKNRIKVNFIVADESALELLKKYGYTSKYSPIYLQCFDPNETMRIKNELFPKMGMELKLVQLIAETSWNETMVYNSKGEAVPYNYDWIFEKDGVSKI